MGRKRTAPWLRKWDNCWYTTLNRKPVKLGTAEDPPELIQARFAELVALTEKPEQWTVKRVCHDFLAYCERHRSPATHEWYKDFLDSFTASIKPSLPVDKLAPSIVNNWIDKKYGKSSPSTRNGAARSIVRAMNWAVDERIIDRSPLVGFTKPAASNREVTITPAQYQKCLNKAKGPILDVVKFLWHTGCRPQEIRLIEMRWIDVVGNKIVLPVAKSKGKRKRRVIYLNPTAREIALRLAEENLYGPIFRNTRNQPWSKGSLNCAFRRLKDSTKIEGLCAYALRHGFATETLKRGVDTTTVSVLMGNSPRMVAEVYQHIAQDHAYLSSVVNAG